MIIVDTALARREQEGRPVQVGLIGAGFMGRGIGQQLLSPLAGLRLAAVCSRKLSSAQRVYRDAQAPTPILVETAAALDEALCQGRPAVCDDPLAICHAEGIDVVVECTGEVEFGARVALAAIDAGKHVVLVNAELDATIGPLLKQRAAARGVVLTNTDGDEPGVAMNLLRFVRTVGYRPVLAGNIKGFIDRYRTPDTQREFAARHGQEPPMITSFADGTKLSMEAAILANAAGFKVAQRGMRGPRCAHVKNVLEHFTPDELSGEGFVDYVLGAEPGTGAFVVGYNEHPVKRQYMQYFKMGEGPWHVFHTPYHLPHLEVAVTIARAALFGDAAVSPLGGPQCDVVAVAKRDLAAGETLDGIGGFTCYGTIENAAPSLAEGLLPMGLSRGCRLTRAVAKDQALTRADVALPAGRLCDELRCEQDALFFPEIEHEPALARASA